MRRSCLWCDVSAEAIRQRILNGATVHMGFPGGERVWWMEDPYEEIDDATMQAAMLGGNGNLLLVEVGDSLFGWEANSQTWVSAFAG